MKDYPKAHVPSYMNDAFARQGVDPGTLLYAIHTDSDPRGEFSDVYVAVSRGALHVLYGEERVVKTDGPRRIVADYRADELIQYELDKLGELRTEKLLSTGRLIVGSPLSPQEAAKKKAEEAQKAGKPGPTDAAVADEAAAPSDRPETDIPERLLLSFTLGRLAAVERVIKVIANIREGAEPLRDVLLDEELFCPKCGTRYPEPDRKLCPKCMDKTSISLRLLGFFGHYRAKVAVVFVFMLLSTGFTVFSPMIGTRLFLDEVLTAGGQYYGAVLAVVLMIAGVKAVTVTLNILYTYVLARIIPWIVYDLKLRIFEAMQRLSVGFYTSKRTGALMDRVNRDANNIYWFFVDGLPFMVVNILMFAAVISLMFFIHAGLAAICLSIIGVSVGLFRLLWSLFRRFHHKNWVYNAQMNSMVSDAVNGQRVIKAFAREDEEVERFSSVSGKQRDVDTQMMHLGMTAFPLIYLFLFTGQVFATAIGGIMVVRGQLSLGTLLTFIGYFTMMYGPLEFMSWVSNWWARCVDAAQRVFEIIDSKADIEEPENPVTLSNMRGAVEVTDVWFEYDPATPVLKGLSLSVPAGKTLGIVGKTGAGKTTLANLIARLYDVKEGSITVDGVNVKELSLKQLRRNIGIVSQDIYLFIGSIAENIRYARPEATMDEVVNAAKMASAHDFITALPDAYETRVGAGGQDLSGGERQRLSIARTIIQNPGVLILDEATAAMDTDTESRIQAALNKLQTGRTTIAIAHRLSTLRDADMLAVIHEGRVTETGTHDELIRLDGEYRKLYNIQIEGLKVISMGEAPAA